MRFCFAVKKDKESENDKEFIIGVTVGINIHKQKVVMAHEKGKSIQIDGESYFIQSGNERLQEVTDKICG